MRLLILSMLVLSQTHAVELPPSDHPFGVQGNDSRLDALCEGLEMSVPGPTGLVQVKNSGGGFMLLPLDDVSASFIDFSKKSDFPTLDIGSAYGVASLPVLHESGGIVIADDVGDENLLILRNHADPNDRERLFLTNKRFPQELDFPADSLGSVLICRVFHFLKGEEIEQGLEKVRRWLVPGGKLFIVTSTPYQKNLIDFVPIYEQRWADGNIWPGYVENYGPTATSISHNLSPFLHVMEERPLRRSLENAGFIVEHVQYIDRRKTIPALSIDGHEGIGIIATKGHDTPPVANVKDN